MPPPALFLILAALMPLLGFGVLLPWGRRIGPAAGWIAVGFALAAFGFSMAAMVSWYDSDAHVFQGVRCGVGQFPISASLPWLPIGARLSQAHQGYLDVGIYVDSLTVAMFAMVTLVAVLTQIFVIGSLKAGSESGGFFAWTGLTLFAVLGLVLGGTLVQIMLFWGLLSFCTFQLIGDAGDRPAASGDASRAFMCHAVGDIGLLMAAGLLFARLGNATLPRIWILLAGSAAAGRPAALPGGAILPTSLLTLIGIGFFWAAMSKSAQFPFQLWLTEAGRTPIHVLALICATTTSAGVYLVARMYPIFTADARLFISVVGLLTLTLGAIVALAQIDLRRILAWCAVSQLGWVMLAMGVGSWVGALFHLITQAFFLTLMFLCAASVSAARDSATDLPMPAGLWRDIKLTAILFGIGVLGVAGTPLLGGYYSRSAILTDAAAFAIYGGRAGGRGFEAAFFFALPVAVSYLTAFYMTRCWMLTFIGDRSRERSSGRPRERAILWAPLVALAGVSVISGYAMNIPELLKNAVVETRHRGASGAPAGAAAGQSPAALFDNVWPAALSTQGRAADLSEPPDDPVTLLPRVTPYTRGRALQWTWTRWAWAVGILAALAAYSCGIAFSRLAFRFPPVRFIARALQNGLFIDDFFSFGIVGIGSGLSAACGVTERYLFDGAITLLPRLLRRATVRARLRARHP